LNHETTNERGCGLTGVERIKRTRKRSGSVVARLKASLIILKSWSSSKSCLGVASV
jgi:hypothetical protein